MSYGVHLEGGLSSCYVLKRLVSGLVATIGFDDRVFVGGLRIEMSIASHSKTLASSFSELN